MKGFAKELICIGHGHRQECGEGQGRGQGRGGGGQSGDGMGDTCNSVNNNFFFLKKEDAAKDHSLVHGECSGNDRGRKS